jgi:hypothetical protein
MSGVLYRLGHVCVRRHRVVLAAWGLVVFGLIAAVQIAGVFASFILNGDPTVKQFGVGLAVAIAVDATIVRRLLVPATMIIVGRGNWYFPAWLDRALPRVGLESEDGLPSLQSVAPSRGELARSRTD